MIKHLPLASIRRDGGTQMRAEIDMLVVAEYAEAYREGADMPPLVAFDDGSDCWLADGFMRVLAAEKAGLVRIACDLRPGSLRDAILFACGANATHGLRRTNKDKRRAVETMLRDAEWVHWGDTDIGVQTGVDNKTVGNIRHELEASLEIPKIDSRKVKRGGTIYTQDSSQIGLSKQTAPLPGQTSFLDESDGPEDESEPSEDESTTEDEVPSEDATAGASVNGGVSTALRRRESDSDRIRRKFLHGLKDFDDYTRAVMAREAHAGFGGFPAVLATIAPQERTFVAAQIELLIERLEEWLTNIREQST